MPRMRFCRFAALGAAVVLAPQAAAQVVPDDTGRLSVERVFRTADFDDASQPTRRWMPDGTAWLELRAGAIVRVDAVRGRDSTIVAADRLVADGRPIGVQGFTLHGRQLLLSTASRSVIPHKTGATHFVYDLDARRLTRLSADTGAQVAVKLAPDGRRAGFVRASDLWIVDLASGAERRLTSDGSDTVHNGISDWVYDEELDLEDAWRWSPDGARIVFMRFATAREPVYPMVDYAKLNPAVFPLRHPKPGQPNARVTVGVIDLAAGPTRWIALGDLEYLPRVEWLGADSLAVLRMPRSQDRVELVAASATTGGIRPIATERDSAWVDVDDPVWIDGDRRFLWFSDRSGWRQLYLHDRSGRVVRQLTVDGVDVVSLLGVDERSRQVYVQVAEPDPTQKRVWRFPLDGGRGQRILDAPGTASLALAPGARLGIATRSRIGTPPVTELVRLPAGTRVRTLEDNARLRGVLRDAAVREPEFFRIPVREGLELDAYRILPARFDSTRAHPVVIYVYGGPANPTVADAWGDKRYFFHQMLARRGYVVLSVDPRGAAWRGRAFRKATFLRLGAPEAEDVIAATRWLGRQRWADSARIGIWGRSYGGFLTALAAGRGGALFKAALTVVPVTDWRLYDAIYTERYMRTPAENPEGYRLTAPLTWADSIRARMLIVTSTGDDNVHAQNSLQLADRLTAAHLPYEMVVYVNRPHPLSGGNTRGHWYGTMLRFVLEQL